MKHKYIMTIILGTTIISMLKTTVTFSVPKGRVIPAPQDLVPPTSLSIDSKEYSNIKIIESEEGTLVRNATIENGILYDTKEHSVKDVVEQWNQIRKADKKSGIYSQYPSSQKGIYTAGKVKEDYLNECLDYLNFCRYLAYLPEVKLDENLNTISQYGAVLIAKQGLSHTNPKPDDMSEEFYNTALNSTISSNIFFNSSSSSIINGISGCLDDSSNIVGYGNIGHRNHLLSSDLEYTGFGSCGSYSLQYVNNNVDYINEGSKTTYNHNPSPEYICWPAKGAFPKDFINTDTLWSVDLNYYKYTDNSTDNINIKVTRLSDNKVWDIPRVVKNERNITGFTADRSIEFHIASKDLGQGGYFGKYKVEISNIKKADGSTEDIVYTVNFFDLNNNSSGWAYVYGYWYYLDNDGNAKTGWIKDGDDWYFSWSNGQMASNTVVDGYTIDKNGKLIK